MDLNLAALSAGSAAAAAKPAALLSWLLPLLLGLALIALLLRWRWAWLTDCYDWFVVNIGGLLEPLRGRRHVIHDPKYLRRILEAEFGSIDPARSARPGQPRRPPRPGWRWGHRRSRRWRRSRR